MQFGIDSQNVCLRGKRMMASTTLSPYSDTLLPALRGHAVGICDLWICGPMSICDARDAMCDYYPGFYSWVLRDVKTIKPLPVRGMLRLFEVEVPDEIRLG